MQIYNVCHVVHARPQPAIFSPLTSLFQKGAILHFIPIGNYQDFTENKWEWNILELTGFYIGGI
jgi:hypothetical protein